MNLDDLREQVEIEFENLRLLEQETTALLTATRGREPTVVERTAAGAFLAQFYGGVESIMKRFVRSLDARMPAGEAWHMETAAPPPRAGGSH